MEERINKRCRIISNIAWHSPKRLFDNIDRYTLYDELNIDKTNLPYKILFYAGGSCLKLFKHPRVIIVPDDIKSNICIKIKDEKLIYNHKYDNNNKIKQCIDFIYIIRLLIRNYWYNDLYFEKIENFSKAICIDKISISEASRKILGWNDYDY